MRMMNSREAAARIAALVAVTAAIVLAVVALLWLDHRPRTHDAHIYADTTLVAPDVSGRIIKIRVRDNQDVRKGDVLVDIDPEPFQLRVAQGQAQVDALQAQIDLTTRQIAAQTTGADAAATQIRRAHAQLAFARDTRRRLEPMLGEGYVTEQQIDEARTNERTAEVALETSTQQSTQARQAIADTESLMAQLRGAEASLSLAERDLRNATLRAPFDGRISGLEIAEGSYAIAAHALFTLIDTRQWYAIADFRETELGHIHAGDAATVWLMADTSRPLKGHIESLGGGVHPDNGGGAPGLPVVERSLKWVVVAQRFPVRVLLDGPPSEALRIGATASVRVSGDHVH
jgi:multidrug efflux system membrane fusion protein